MSQSSGKMTQDSKRQRHTLDITYDNLLRLQQREKTQKLEKPTNYGSPMHLTIVSKRQIYCKSKWLCLSEFVTTACSAPRGKDISEARQAVLPQKMGNENSPLIHIVILCAL